MNDTETRFEAVRERARAAGLDLRLLVGPRMYEGERSVTYWPDGSVTEGLAIGDDDSTLREELMACDAFIAARANER